MVHIKKKHTGQKIGVMGCSRGTLYTAPPLLAEWLSKIKVMQAMESEAKVIAGA